MLPNDYRRMSITSDKRKLVTKDIIREADNGSHYRSLKYNNILHQTLELMITRKN